ncbi:MAG: Serine/threonine-protein kinase PknD [Phycisphaerae bacterium]|nr:Serine/threonine-protein kinase PknD [Phycisphaerae bacterium]
MAYTYKHGDRPLEGYQIQRAVGRGGFGEVYYAVSDSGREVALKYLRDNPEVELRGITQCMNLKSPYLVNIFDVKQNAQGEYFVIMEYVNGPSLRDMLIAEPKGLGLQKAAFFVRELAKGLSYLHDRGIVHRDLKPGNIFYEDGYAKIGDYGLSKFISVSRHSAQTSSVGTVHYMAPEVGSGNYSKTIDIYALGVMLYEMLLGRVPYEGASMGEVLMKHLTQQPEVDQLPAPFADVIRKALAKDPKDRYQDVSEMVESIFGQEQIQESMRGFEPASLTIYAARAAQDVPRMQRSPVDLNIGGRKEGVAGFNPRGADIQGVGAQDFSKRFVERALGQAPVGSGLPAGVARPQRSGKMGIASLKPIVEQGDTIRSSVPISGSQRLLRLLSALVVTVLVSVGAGLISNDRQFDEFCAGAVGVILLSVVGLGIGNSLIPKLGPQAPGLIQRLLLTGCGALGCIFLGSGPHYVTDIIVPYLIMLFVLDWRHRIRMGLRGEFGWWEAVTASIWMFVGSAIADGDHLIFWAAGLGAGLSISLQAFSWACIRNPLPPDDDPNWPKRTTEPLELRQALASPETADNVAPPPAPMPETEAFSPHRGLLHLQLATRAFDRPSPRNRGGIIAASLLILMLSSVIALIENRPRALEAPATPQALFQMQTPEWSLEASREGGQVTGPGLAMKADASGAQVNTSQATIHVGSELNPLAAQPGNGWSVGRAGRIVQVWAWAGIVLCGGYILYKLVARRPAIPVSGIFNQPAMLSGDWAATPAMDVPVTNGVQPGSVRSHQPATRESRSVLIAYILWLFFGILGVHRIYCNRIGTALIWFLTGGLLGIGWLVDLFLIPRLVREADDRASGKFLV